MGVREHGGRQARRWWNYGRGGTPEGSKRKEKNLGGKEKLKGGLKHLDLRGCRWERSTAELCLWCSYSSNERETGGLAGGGSQQTVRGFYTVQQRQRSSWDPSSLSGWYVALQVGWDVKWVIIHVVNSRGCWYCESALFMLWWEVVSTMVVGPGSALKQRGGAYRVETRRGGGAELLPLSLMFCSL